MENTYRVVVFVFLTPLSARHHQDVRRRAPERAGQVRAGVPARSLVAPRCLHTASTQPPHGLLKASPLSVAQYLEEMDRHNYVTPTSYLELLKAVNTLIDKKRGEIQV